MRSLLPLLFIAAEILLFTLSPFTFQSFSAFGTWSVRFSLIDIVSNVLLFLPLGIVFRHIYRRPHWIALLCGLGFSLLIETMQLSIELRSSNVVDVLTNGSGALVGSWLHQLMFAKSLPLTLELPFAMMFIPICWVGGIHAFFDPVAAWSVLPSAIAGVLLIQYTQQERVNRVIVALLLLASTAMPLSVNGANAAALLSIIAAIAIYLTYRFGLLPLSLIKRLVLSLSVAGLTMVIFSSAEWPFNPYSEAASFPDAIKTGELLMLISITMAALIWQRDHPSEEPR